MRTELRGERWACGVTAALVLGLSGPIAFLWIALRTPVDLVSRDPWGANLDQVSEERMRALDRESGWSVSLRAERTRDGVHVELEPSTRKLPLPGTVELRLRRERPDRSDLDAEIAVVERDGRWTAEVPLPAPGRWNLLARAGSETAWIERSFALEVSK